MLEMLWNSAIKRYEYVSIDIQYAHDAVSVVSSEWKGHNYKIQDTSLVVTLVY